MSMEFTSGERELLHSALSATQTYLLDAIAHCAVNYTPENGLFTQLRKNLIVREELKGVCEKLGFAYDDSSRYADIENCPDIFSPRVFTILKEYR